MKVFESALYHGWVKHRRYSPVQHAFRYRVHLAYLDLEELPHVFGDSWLYSADRPAVARFRRRDHFGAVDETLDESVRRAVAERSGQRPEGPIRLLTHLRYFGYCFNPVSFFYCFDRLGETVRGVLAEVNNTPWGERHLYWLEPVAAAGASEVGGPWHCRHGKAFHVSPFMPMDLVYDWSFSRPGTSLTVGVGLERSDGRLFDACLELERCAISVRSLRRTVLRQPLMTFKVITAIYWQALRLRLKGAPFFPHPEVAEKEPTTTHERGIA